MMTYKEWIRHHAPPIWNAEDVWIAAQEECAKRCIEIVDKYVNYYTLEAVEIEIKKEFLNNENN